ncbi:hypothetical protein AG1IA_10459 [Rhizoctonia solani AG-1 IA]|uniref:Uncharacterized protein n=1 Tax=Thanatephorus cucumeris (strain AG1-IA) TaxID=983506 RepID=L8WBG4_THACA|nr:hypothetical protein AG1IA_10459 [Rhizoctonia solani AG-1 IA]
MHVPKIGVLLSRRLHGVKKHLTWFQQMLLSEHLYLDYWVVLCYPVLSEPIVPRTLLVQLNS